MTREEANILADCVTRKDWTSAKRCHLLEGFLGESQPAQAARAGITSHHRHADDAQSEKGLGAGEQRVHRRVDVEAVDFSCLEAAGPQTSPSSNPGQQIGPSRLLGRAAR